MDIKRKMPSSLLKIMEIMLRNNFQAYLVGGSLRDIICGKTPKDWDLAVSATPDEMTEYFLKERKIVRQVIDVGGKKYGTMLIIAYDYKRYEVTTMREEEGYLDLRHPDVIHFTSEILQDLSRRDFTMNAMAYGLEKGLVDPYLGINDIRQGIIRSVRNPYDRFQEDALRMLRAIRFACQLGFFVEEETQKAILALRANLEKVSLERIREELQKMLTADFRQNLHLLQTCGLFEILLPEMHTAFFTEQHHKYHIYNVGEHTLKTVEAIKPTPLLTYSALFHDLGKPQKKTTDEEGEDHFYGHQKISAVIATNFFTKYKISRKIAIPAKTLILHHDESLLPSRRSILLMLRKIGKELFPALLELKKADILAQNPEFQEERLQNLEKVATLFTELMKSGACYRAADLRIKGSDLLKMGYKPSRKFTQTLRKILDEVVDGSLDNTEEALQKRAIEFLGEIHNNKTNRISRKNKTDLSPSGS